VAAQKNKTYEFSKLIKFLNYGDVMSQEFSYLLVRSKERVIHPLASGVDQVGEFCARYSRQCIHAMQIDLPFDTLLLNCATMSYELNRLSFLFRIKSF
jgi:hypothetical protein